MPLFFELKHQSKNARLGIIHTPHGDFETPAFMSVGTQATVKTLDPRDLQEIGAQIILANAYHLHLRPGEDIIAKMGGLHQFMGWHGPILTDSGGFQVFSLSTDYGLRTTDKNLPIFSARGGSPPAGWRGAYGGKDYKIRRLVEIDEDGVTFRSHLDGSLHRFTPESAMEIQRQLGADIIMAFDQCTRDDASQTETIKAMKRTHRWARRCIDFHQKYASNRHAELVSASQKETKRSRNKFGMTMKQFLFGIIQGGRFKSLRLKSTEFIASLPFDGLAIGGETIGYNMPMTKKVMDWIEPLLPKEKPRYAMGVGFSPADLFAVVEIGIDMFDCVAPTRLARNGALYISPEAGGSPKNKYRLNIANAQFIRDPKPLDPWCDCPVCKGFGRKEERGKKKNNSAFLIPHSSFLSRAYLNHLFRADELLALRLASLHNVRFMLKLMEEIRQAIVKDRLEQLKKEWVK